MRDRQLFWEEVGVCGAGKSMDMIQEKLFANVLF